MVYGGYVDADGNAASNTVDNSTDPLEVVEFMLITLIPTPISSPGCFEAAPNPSIILLRQISY